MENQIGLIVKVMLLSGVLSFLIKYATPDILIPSTVTNVLILVLSPTVIMAVLLGARLIGAKRS
ncbi:hypothetical protein NIES4071_15980 [Calothrix sp. NIES-4071]|nr:hypothetical protein NIES4071_15980 [Calothrix sp. NIES-4071]BAZ55935.1 hypothetical protein NIES4105_15930 [Calothrix sp. NIES-4105]